MGMSASKSFYFTFLSDGDLSIHEVNVSALIFFIDLMLL